MRMLVAKLSAVADARPCLQDACTSVSPSSAVAAEAGAPSLELICLDLPTYLLY